MRPRSGSQAITSWIVASQKPHSWVPGCRSVVTGTPRAAARASVADDPDVASRLTWEHRDLTAWEPPASAFDLVSAQYVHLPADQLTALLAGLGRAVAPGGTLLVVGHDPTDTHAHRAPLLQSAAQLAARLDAREWEILVSEARPRTTDGRIDAVLRARRRTSG